MTERAYITVDRAESPRIIEVAAPGGGGSDEVVIQDLHDTLNSNTLPAGDADDSLLNMDDEFLIDSAGKEDLGGGVLVGITSILNNAQVAFEGNYTPQSTGTATSVDATGRTLTDTGATFETDGVERGAIIINWTDQSVAEVTTVVSETVIDHRMLQGGTDDDWSINDDYSIFNIIQKEISGGNLVAVDDDADFPEGTDISPVFPTFATQIVRTASSSATLQEQQDIQYASFNGGVTVDVTSPFSGTTFPNGTPRQPVNNMVDAEAIASERGFTVIYIIGNLTLSTVTDFTGFTFVGDSPNKTLLTVNAAANVTNSEFTNCTIQGTLDGGNVVRDSAINTLDFVEGFIERCVINGTITLSGVSTANLLDCFSGVPGLTTPVIDLNGSGSALAVRNYNGGILLRNKTGPEDVSIDMSSGQVILEDTVGGSGDVVIRGVGTWTNALTYAGAAFVSNQLIEPQDQQSLLFFEGISVDTVNGVAGTIYPRGTPRMPVNNMADAAAIAAERSIMAIRFLSDATVSNEADWFEFTFRGVSEGTVNVTFTALASTDDITLENLTVSGTITGSNINGRSCLLEDGLTIHSGLFTNAGLKGELVLSGSSTDAVRFHQCFGAADPGSSQPGIDCGGDGPLITLAGYHGGMGVRNKTGSASCGISMSGGILNLESTVTAGAILCAGVCQFNDNSTGAAVVVDLITRDTPNAIANHFANTVDGLSFEDITQVLLTMAQGKMQETSPGSNIFRFFAQDNTTVLYTLQKTTTERLRV